MMYAESCRAKRKVQNADLEFIVLLDGVHKGPL